MCCGPGGGLPGRRYVGCPPNPVACAACAAGAGAPPDPGQAHEGLGPHLLAGAHRAGQAGPCGAGGRTGPGPPRQGGAAVRGRLLAQARQVPGGGARPPRGPRPGGRGPVRQGGRPHGHPQQPFHGRDRQDHAQSAPV